MNSSSITREDGVTTLRERKLPSPSFEPNQIVVTDDDATLTLRIETGGKHNMGMTIRLDHRETLALIEDLQQRYARIDPQVVGIVGQYDEADNQVGFVYTVAYDEA